MPDYMWVVSPDEGGSDLVEPDSTRTRARPRDETRLKLEGAGGRHTPSE